MVDVDESHTAPLPPFTAPAGTAGVGAAVAEMRDQLKASADTMAAANSKSKTRMVWEYLSGALTDAKTGRAVLSLARLSWVVWFAQAVYRWQTAEPTVDPIPLSELTVGLTLLGHITISGVRDAVVKRLKGSAGV